MPKNTAPPPTTTRAPAIPAMRPVLEFAPVSARFESPAAGDGALLAVPAGAELLSEADGLGDSSAGAEADCDGDGVAGGVDSPFEQPSDGVFRLPAMSLSTIGRSLFFPAVTWTRYSAFGAQSSLKVTTTPSREPVTFCSPTCFASAPLFSRNTVMVAGVPEASLSVTVMTPLPPAHLASAENSLMLQASALPAALRASAEEAAATPRICTERRAVRRVMDTFALHGVRNCGGLTLRVKPPWGMRHHFPQESHRSISVP